MTTSRADRLEATLRRLTAMPLLLAAMALSGAYIVVLGSKLSFLLDDWGYIVLRRGNDLDTWMRPDNEHFVAGPVAVWKLLIAVFGIESMLPFKLVSTALFLIGAWFLFLWLRRRVGEWVALLMVVALLFLGAAFDDLLWFASITFLGSMAGGLGMLVALDRRDQRGDRLACLGLLVSLIFSSLWVAFAAGAALDVFLRRRERPWLRRVFIVAVPALIYIAWWIGWGHEAESALSLHNVIRTPLWVFDSIAAAVAALLGLAIPAEWLTAPNGLDWGRPLTVGLLALALWRLWRMPRIPRSLWVVIAIGFVFWILGGFDVKPGRAASASRYQYPGAAFVLMIAGGLLAGVRFQRRMLAPALVVLGAAVLPNVVFFHEAYESYFHTSELERADLAALEISRPQVEPTFFMPEELADTGYVPVEAQAYFEARDADGSPAYDEAELLAAPEDARIPADKVLAGALRIGLTATPPPGPDARCARRSAGGEAEPVVVKLPPGGIVLRASAPLEASLSRFSESFPVQLEEIKGGGWSALRIPRDTSRRPWLLRLVGEGEVMTCGR